MVPIAVLGTLEPIHRVIPTQGRLTTDFRPILGRGAFLVEIRHEAGQFGQVVALITGIVVVWHRFS